MSNPKAKSMREAEVDELVLERPQSDPKRRACLRCQTPFESGWAGERICSKCKQSSAWRGGEPT